MINKITSDIEPILKAIPDGATIMTSGFGVTGQPAELIEALIDLGKKELTIVNNNAASGDRGLTRLIIAGCVRKMISSFPKSAGSTVFQDLYRAGKIELELVSTGQLSLSYSSGGCWSRCNIYTDRLWHKSRRRQRKPEPLMVETTYLSIRLKLTLL